MYRQYYEIRKPMAGPQTTVAADIAKHMQPRQYLGTVLVICDNPHSMLSATRKLWLKGARHLQKLRASTLNAEEILRLTHAIMHMQNMLFLAKSPAEHPDAAVYFVTPDQLTIVPYSCYSVYITTPITEDQVTAVSHKLPPDCLFVNYMADLAIKSLSLAPKSHMEERVSAEWERTVAFLQRHKVNPDALVVGNTLQFGAMDNALDALLEVSSDFLRQAASLQHAINLAQPLTITQSDQQKLFEAVTRLAHRVQALSPGTFNNYLLNSFGDSEATTFFLRDVGSELYEDLERAARAVLR